MGVSGHEFGRLGSAILHVTLGPHGAHCRARFFLGQRVVAHSCSRNLSWVGLRWLELLLEMSSTFTGVSIEPALRVHAVLGIVNLSADVLIAVLLWGGSP